MKLINISDFNFFIFINSSCTEDCVTDVLVSALINADTGGETEKQDW